MWSLDEWLGMKNWEMEARNCCSFHIRTTNLLFIVQYTIGIYHLYFETASEHRTHNASLNFSSFFFCFISAVNCLFSTVERRKHENNIPRSTYSFAFNRLPFCVCDWVLEWPPSESAMNVIDNRPTNLNKIWFLLFGYLRPPYYIPAIHSLISIDCSLDYYAIATCTHQDDNTLTDALASYSQHGIVSEEFISFDYFAIKSSTLARQCHRLLLPAVRSATNGDEENEWNAERRRKKRERERDGHRRRCRKIDIGANKINKISIGFHSHSVDIMLSRAACDAVVTTNACKQWTARLYFSLSLHTIDSNTIDSGARFFVAVVNLFFEKVKREEEEFRNWRSGQKFIAAKEMFCVRAITRQHTRVTFFSRCLSIVNRYKLPPPLTDTKPNVRLSFWFREWTRGGQETTHNHFIPTKDELWFLKCLPLSFSFIRFSYNNIMNTTICILCCVEVYDRRSNATDYTVPKITQLELVLSLSNSLHFVCVCLRASLFVIVFCCYFSLSTPTKCGIHIRLNRTHVCVCMCVCLFISGQLNRHKLTNRKKEHSIKQNGRERAKEIVLYERRRRRRHIFFLLLLWRPKANHHIVCLMPK